MTFARRMLMAAAGRGVLDVADVFSTDLWTGDNTARSIVNGLKMSTFGGLTWIKKRGGAANNQLYDTERGALKRLVSNDTGAESNTSQTLTAFNADGYSLGTNDDVDDNGLTFVGWTFRRAPNFFDVVTYTGDGVAGRTVAHSLGAVPGMIIIKRMNFISSWLVYHRANTANPETDYLILNNTAATFDDVLAWNDTAPTDAVFTLGTDTSVNENGGTYVAYLFAHDTSASGIIQCGSAALSGVTTITLGWQPQFVFYKSVGLGSWLISDSARGIPTGSGDKILRPHLSNAELTSEDMIDLTSTGFTLDAAALGAATYIYMAIRAES